MSNRRPILLGTPEVIDPVLPVIRQMLATEGLYIGMDPSRPNLGEVPLVSMGGKIFCLVIDHELDPERFIDGTTYDGPFRAGDKPLTPEPP